MLSEATCELKGSGKLPKAYFTFPFAGLPEFKTANVESSFEVLLAFNEAAIA
jgi:hypothetical protein